MGSNFEIRPLVPAEVAPLIALRKEALEANPLAFGASLQDDKTLSPEFLRTSLADPQTSVIVGLFDGADLVGMVGVVRGTQMKRRHRAGIWGMYVSPRARGKGGGRRLLEAAIEVARGWPGVEQVHLSVTETSVEAWRLYESAGFKEWGREPRSVMWEGRYVEEIHMMLDLAEYRKASPPRGE
ncbi:MAG TPA: GNAT family N-acetyltransferase [Thermoanaerobaculia bacterium]